MDSKQPDTPWDAAEMLHELDGGVFMMKLARAVQDGALAATEHGREAQISMTLKLKQINESNVVNAAHKIAYKHPTKNGVQSEEDETKTPLYVGQRGRLSVSPEIPTGFDFSAEPAPESTS